MMIFDSPKKMDFFATEVFKSIKSLSLHFMWSHFSHKSITYDLRKENLLNVPPVKPNKYGPNSSLSWGIMP